MDTTVIVTLLHESLFMLVVFGALLMYAVTKGRQSITNLILGLYFALLISLEFPYYDELLAKADSAKTESIIILVLFGIFTLIATIMFTRLLPREYDEKKFEGFGKKLLLALSGTILIMIFSYHVLPITEFITPGSPIHALFAPEDRFFFWLLVPIAALLIL